MFGNEYFTKFLHTARIHAFIAFYINMVIRMWKMVHNKKITPSNPNMLDFDYVKRIGNSQGRKKTRDYYLDVASGKTIKMEVLEQDQ